MSTFAFHSRQPLSNTAPVTREPAAAAWSLPASTALPWAIALALLMSTRFLFQPFVWAHWPWDDVLVGWLEVARDRLVVAVTMAVALMLAGRVPARSPAQRIATLATAIAIGAACGEGALLASGAPGAHAELRTVLGRVLHWCIIAAGIAVMISLWRRASAAGAATQASELRRARTERHLAQAQLQALRIQIEPHFLFNTLATVRRLQYEEPAQGAQVLRWFLDYLRLTLPALRNERTTLGKEIDLVAAYLGVAAVRMSGRLQVRFDVPDALRNCEFPPLTLATLVENAVKHGVGPAPGGGSIVVQAALVRGALDVAVVDTGIGFSGKGIGGSGIGLANVRARLRTLYGAAGTLTLAANQPTGVRASICLPCALPEAPPR